MMKKSLRIMAALILIASSLFAGGKKDEDNKVLYIYNWSYYTPEEVIADFEKKYDCTVILDYFASNEEMFAKFLASNGVGYDLVVPSGDYVSIMKNSGFLQEIDHSKIPNLSYLTDLIKSKTSFDPGQVYSVPYYMGAAGIAVHKDRVPSYPRSWSIFSDSSLKGKMCMMDDMREVMGDALKYLGYSVNTTDDKELKEAFDLIENQWKPNLAKFDAEGFGKSFSTGEYYAAQGYAEAFFEEIPESKWDEVDFFIPEEGGPLYIDSFVIPKKAKNYDLACAFINFILEPENYARFLDRFHFPSTVHKEADNYRTTVPFYTAEELLNCENKDDLGEDLGKYNDIWQKIRYV